MEVTAHERGIEHVAKFLGLPQYLAENYKTRGIRSLHPWQWECLCQPVVVEGRNFLYTAPTSGGKSLVAEVRYAVACSATLG